jgi:hypothetical protein
MECKFTPLILSEILVVKMQMLAVHTVGLTCLLNIIIQTFYALFNSLSLGGKLHEFLFPDIHICFLPVVDIKRRFYIFFQHEKIHLCNGQP